MPHVTFIYPSVGRNPGTKYIRSWQMQPLSIALLSSLTPAEWDRAFYDDRLEPIDYSKPTDLAAISIETFTARRGYQIAKEYRRRGIPVVMGGYHATFCPDEVLEYADSVCIGEAEGIWVDILHDASKRNLKDKYYSANVSKLSDTKPDRTIFEGKNYFKIALVETSRGCPNTCNFCSITAFHQGKYRSRPISDVISEINNVQADTFFFIDDNIAGNQARAEDFFSALMQLNITWVGQASISIADNEKLLDLMCASGCAGLLIGFESLSPENLIKIGKHINRTNDYSKALRTIRKKGIAVYGTFMLGLPHDSKQLLEQTISFAKDEKIFLAAFNHVVPFPGTPFYKNLSDTGSLTTEQWWLSPDYRFGQAPFSPECFSASELENLCFKARKNFFSLHSIIKRATNLSSNCNSLRKTILYWGINLLMLHEVGRKHGIPLGCPEDGDIKNV